MKGESVALTGLAIGSQSRLPARRMLRMSIICTSEKIVLRRPGSRYRFATRDASSGPAPGASCPQRTRIFLIFSARTFGMAGFRYDKATASTGRLIGHCSPLGHYSAYQSGGCR
jgi:hypothetical protein